MTGIWACVGLIVLFILAAIDFARCYPLINDRSANEDAST